MLCLLSETHHSKLLIMPHIEKHNKTRSHIRKGWINDRINGTQQIFIINNQCVTIVPLCRCKQQNFCYAASWQLVTFIEMRIDTKYLWIAVTGLLVILSDSSAAAQADSTYRSLHFGSTHTPFPDTGRANGYLDGDHVFRPVTGHYDDSSVLLIIPGGLRKDRTVDLVFWFHGWHNNIDTAVEFYALARQLAASGRNAILVMPEAAKNAADSYGGKLRQNGMFKGLVGDVLYELKSKGIVDRKAVPGHIVLAGHSGAYSVIADILQSGQAPVDEVFLFDALYGRLPVFLNCIREDNHHHFGHWYTNHGGGTDEMSDSLMLQLQNLHRDYLLTTEADLKPSQIRDNRILFVHSLREHNVIINDPDDFRLLLENSLFLRGH